MGNSHSRRAEIKQYFEEAHQCYLYGFNIACAVLCRSILESAFIERFDPPEKNFRRSPWLLLDLS